MAIATHKGIVSSMEQQGVDNQNLIKLSSAYFGEEEIEAVARVLRSQVVNMGIEVREFEGELKKFFGREDADVTTVHSCTAAIQLALQACGIKPGDEVLVPTFTFVATFQAVSANGAIPIPCDIDLDDGFINLLDAERRVNSRTRCIIPVLYAGCDSKIASVYDFAKKHNLQVIEDAAHCFGDENIAKREGIICFSFDPIKNISCGDGGCILTARKEVTERLKDIRLLGVKGDTERRFHGQRSWDADVSEQGWRLHMNNISAAIGRAQLKKFGIMREIRQRNARLLLENLKSIEQIRLFPLNVKTAVPHIFPIVVKDGNRDALKDYLKVNGIETGVQYKPNHLLTYFNRGYDLPNAMELYRTILSLPIHPHVSEQEVYRIIEKVSEFFTSAKK